jgi:hypothetical protein
MNMVPQNADDVLAREAMDAMSRSIQRLRSFSEQDFPPILITQELDLLERLLANLRTLIAHEAAKR